MNDEIKTATALEDIEQELKAAQLKFPSFHSLHEGYAVLLEEQDELWDRIKEWKGLDARKAPAIRREAIQVAAMALRFVVELC